MLAGSFRVVTARLFPRHLRRKQALLVALLILAGCGGSSRPNLAKKWQTVMGTGFRFQAPRGWKVSGTSASRGSELVQVASFRLVRPYADSLFDRVAVELQTRMAAVAAQTGGTISGRSTVTAAGVRSHPHD